MKPEYVVVVDSDSARRNSVARLLYAPYRHVEPYESFDELRAFWPDAGVVLLQDDDEALKAMFDIMLERGSWLPLVVYAVDPELERIVDVIRMGAMDYIKWPATKDVIERSLHRLSSRDKSFSELRRRAAHSQKLVQTLTRREREVLFCLARGASNKSAAKELQLSPRTIEIHRANLMGKLGVTHLGEAVSIALYSDLTGESGGEDVFDPLAIQQ